MKKLMIAIALIILFGATPAIALPASTGTCVLTQSGSEPGAEHMWRQYTCTADATDGSMLPYTITGFNSFYLYSVETWPGTTPPDDETDFTLLNSVTGEDMMGGNGTGKIDATSTLTVIPRSAAMELNFYHMVKYNLSLVITGQTALGAIMNVRITGVR